MADKVHTKEQRTARLRELEREKAKLLAQAPRRQIHGFVEFIREKGVVGLAIGLAIGTAASGLVTQMVNAVITPTVNLIIGKEGLKGLNTTIHMGSHEALYRFGDLIDALIKFLAIAAVIYFVVLGLKLDRLDKKKEE
jgi:large conductance mechanosensitive channel